MSTYACVRACVHACERLKSSCVAGNRREPVCRVHRRGPPSPPSRNQPPPENVFVCVQGPKLSRAKISSPSAFPDLPYLSTQKPQYHELFVMRLTRKNYEVLHQIIFLFGKWKQAFFYFRVLSI